MTLADTLEGDKVKVLKVGGGKTIKQRMLDMGVTPGSIISVERYAPLKDPIHIKVKSYSLALRVAEGKNIEVEPA
ncbi:MAG: ferrous iron transport protein A [Victivallales bacterium]|nr:ferrous iron transport protein A [Victivallales bacterium]